MREREIGNVRLREREMERGDCDVFEANDIFVGTVDKNRREGMNILLDTFFLLFLRKKERKKERGTHLRMKMEK